MTMAYRVGQIVPSSESAPFIGSGPARWYGLRCVPQKESALSAWLAHRKIDAFYPVTKARKPVPRGRQRWCEYERKYLPGYVFAHMPGRVIWDRFFDRCQYARDVIRFASDGWPAPLAWKDLELLHNMRSVEAAKAERQRLAEQIQKGDRVRFDLAGVEMQRIEVLEIRGAYGMVRLGLLGEAPVSVALADMEKIQIVA